MPDPEVIVTSCLCFSNVSCYEIAKDFSGPITAVFLAFFSIKFAFKQIAEQHSNTLSAQNNESKRNTRIELFKDISQLLEQSSSTIMEVNSYCMNKKYSNMEMKSEINDEEYLVLMNKFSQALLSIVSKIESHEIVNLKLFRAFRFSLQSIHHVLLKIQLNKDRFYVLETFIELTNEAQMYIGDFQVCMQNMAYGEVFNTSVPHRVPADKRYKVITNDPQELDALIEFFSKETSWGKNNLKYEKEANEKYSS